MISLPEGDSFASLFIGGSGIRHCLPARRFSASIVARKFFDFGSFSFGVDPRQPLKEKLYELIQKSNGGIQPFSAADEKEFETIIQELSTLNPTPEPARSPLFSGEWQLLWTTEKELNFAIEKGLFGLKCSGSTQNIDVKAGTLENRILFEEESFLKVGSSLVPDANDAARFNFEFSECALKWRMLEVPLPPVGKGWGELVYLDKNIRIQKDSRGDTLIAEKI